MIGLTLETDPVLGADSRTIDLNLSVGFDMASPRWTPALAKDGASVEFFEHKISTMLTLLDGMPSIASVWTPSGNETVDADVLQVLVLVPKVVVVEPTSDAE